MDWLRAAHPDVATQFGSGVVGALPGADDMATAIEYVAEFVDQTYPEAEIIAALEADRDRLVATIEAMLEAYNRHDPEEWLSFFPDGIDLDDAGGLTIEHEQAFMAANGRWTLTGECLGVGVCALRRSGAGPRGPRCPAEPGIRLRDGACR
jgi:hypothetical protein